jgi:2-phosphosulfolactate phosphatase
MFFDQWAFDIRCEWGEAGLRQLVAGSDAVVIVDILSFSTCVDIAAGNGASVYPYRWQDASAAAYAQSLGALLASSRQQRTSDYSLSPASLLHIPAGTRLVLPSPNGATLSLATGRLPTFAGCLRNARAVTHALQQYGTRISVVLAGERWGDGSLRPAVEDLLGAGAIIHYLPGTRAPEATVAEATFLRFQTDIAACLRQCGSGQELIGRGFARDVEVAAAFNQSDCAPILCAGAYVRHDATPGPGACV